MADRYLLESGAPDGYLKEDGTGVLLLDAPLPLVDLITSLSPSALWLMDEPSGATAADAIGANDLTLIGSPTRGAASLISADPRTATTFIKEGDYGTAADNAALDLGDTFTLLAMIKRASTGIAHILNKKGTGSTGYGWWFDSGNFLKLTTSDLTNIIDSLATISDTNPHLVAVTKAGATRAMYIDGSATSDPYTNVTLTDNAGTLYVGSYAGTGTNDFDGGMQALAVWKGTALTAQQIADLWAARLVAPSTPVTVTPTTTALATATFAPTITTTNHQLVTPTTKTLALATFAPTVTSTNHQLVTPTTKAVVLATFAPTISLTNHQLVTPTTKALTLATFAPAVSLGIRMTPAPLGLTLTPFAPSIGVSAHITVTPPSRAVLLTAFSPTVSLPVAVVPTTRALSLATFAPTVTATAHQTLTPTTRAVVLTTFAPTISAGAGITVTPTTRALVTATFAPTVTATANQLVTPTTRSLLLTAFAPNVAYTDHRTYTPTTAALVLAMYAPTVTTSGAIGTGPPPLAGAALTPPPAYATLTPPTATASTPSGPLAGAATVTPDGG